MNRTPRIFILSSLTALALLAPAPLARGGGAAPAAPPSRASGAEASKARAVRQDRMKMRGVRFIV